MRRSLTILSIFFSATIGFAQSTNVSTLFLNDFKKGEQFYSVLAYRNALELYLHYEERHPSERLVKERIADCYVRLNKYPEAAQWYDKLTRDLAAQPIEYYQYAQVLSQLKQYDKAADAYLKYLNDSKADIRGKLKLEFLEQMNFHLRDSNLYTVSNEWFNSDQSDFGANYHKNGVVFVSARDRDLFIKRKSLASLNEDESPLNTFFAAKDYDPEKSNEEQVPLFSDKELNSIYHDGPLTFFDGGKKIAFSRNALRNGVAIRDASDRVNLELYFASLYDDNSIGNIHSFPYNDHSYSTGHPWVSKDGSVLYFSSNRPGGFGGADIYRSSFENGKWTEPVNVGEKINTPGDEFHPFIYKDSVMFFSSNGQGGFGGLDIFGSRIENGQYRTPYNLSFPVNSSMDDFSFVMDDSGRKGFLSSNREGGKGYDDIYSFTLNKFTLIGTVVEKTTKEPIDNALVLIRNPDGILVDSVLTDQHGNFYKQLEMDKDFRIRAKKGGFTSIDEINFRTDKNYFLRDTLTIPIWENGLFVKGKIYSNELQAILPGATVTLHDLSSGLSDSLKIGNDGAYKFLIVPNNKYRVSAKKEGHIPEGFNLNTDGIYKGNLVNDILLEEKFLEKLDLLFDFDKAIIKPQFFSLLDKFVKDLKRASGSTVNIGAHADSQGTRDYNLSLSGRRAEAVVDYLVSNGISKSRITARGFGEELILNRCSDGVECTDEEHSLNRRAEMKIQRLEDK
jgi:outer membrane protein OmpA-like peptidoglycan-associated protein/tetratricopeptide (TPR) repeat protein